MIAVLLVRGGPADFRSVVPADAGGHGRGCDRRHPGAEGPDQGGGAELRRPPAGRHHRLPHLHLPPPGPDLARGLLPAGYEAWLFLPLLASIYGFCQVEAKTEDGYFLGFPSLWNVVAIYLYALPFDQWASLAIVITLAIMTFVPSQYLYPSLPGKFNRFISILGIPLTIALVWIIFKLPGDTGARLDPTTLKIAWISMSYPILYLGASWYDQRGLLDEAQAGRGIRGLRR